MHSQPTATPDEAEVPLAGLRCQQILDAATELFAEQGYVGADTQALAERLQVGKGTLYRYFSSKRELFLAAADRVMRRLREHVDAEIAGIDNPIDRIKRGVRAFLDFFAEHPAYVELLIQERAIFKDRSTPTYLLHRENNVRRWQELYRGLIADGRVRDVPVERITGVISNLIYGTIFTNYFSGQPHSPEKQAQDILDIVFHGILTESERPEGLDRVQTALTVLGPVGPAGGGRPPLGSLTTEVSR